MRKSVNDVLTGLALTDEVIAAVTTFPPLPTTSRGTYTNALSSIIPEPRHTHTHTHTHSCRCFVMAIGIVSMEHSYAGSV